MSERPPDDHDRTRQDTLAAIAVFILIVVIGVWALMEYRRSSEQQDCFAQGRHNCAPITLPPR